MNSVEECLTMIAVILGRTFLTDPGQPGIEPLAIQPSKSATAKLDVKVANPGGSPVAVGSVAYVKGRKRAICALALATSMMKDNYDCKSKWPSLWDSLRTVHCAIKGPFDDDAKMFFSSMTISVTTSMLRQRPSFITWVQNLRTRFGCSDAAQAQSLMDSFDALSRGGLAAKLTKKERTAVSTALFGIGNDACEKLLAYCAVHGVTKKTAFGLDTMTSPMWNCGFAPPDVSEKRTALVKTTEASVILCMERMIRDNTAIPESMRKNVSATDAGAMLLNANLLVNSMKLAEADLAAEAFAELKKCAEESSNGTSSSAQYIKCFCW